MGDLIVVTGPPGAGKSTVAALLADRFTPSALVNGDAFFSFVRQGFINPWLAESHSQNTLVISAAAAAAGRLAADYTVVYDGVVGPWALPGFLSGTGLRSLHYAVLLPPVEVCLARIEGRSGHGFTDLDAGRHLHRDFAECVVQERHVVDNADLDPAAAAGRIAAGVSDGTFRHAV